MDSTVSSAAADRTLSDAPVLPAVGWRRRRWALATAGALGLAAVVGFGISNGSPNPDRKDALGVPSEVSKAIDNAIQKASSAPARSAQVYRTILPSLVFISTDKNRDPNSADTSPDSVATDASASENSAATGNRRRGRPKDPELLSGLGTGVIINTDGAILTAHHVISGANSIEVTFSDGTTATATVVSESLENDTAVLIADQSPEVIVPAVLGGGGRVGDEVYAVGHPLGLVDSMSAGVISGLGRSIPLDDELTLEGLIQFDAAVNPGNSGGPLLNRNGQVIGIVTALANPTDQNFFVGIGFAVPIETAGAGANGPGTGIQR
jgi:S1-C subfamily serine protease